MSSSPNHGRSDAAPRLSVTVVWVGAVAEQEALDLGHRRLGTEHLLLALVRMGDPVGRRLGEQGATVARVRRLVGRMTPPGPMDNANRRPGWSTRASAVMEGARRAAGAAGRREATTADLATVLLDPDGRAARMLAELGVDADAVRAAVEGSTVPPVPAAVPRQRPRHAARADQRSARVLG